MTSKPVLTRHDYSDRVTYFSVKVNFKDKAICQIFLRFFIGKTKHVSRANLAWPPKLEKPMKSIVF